MKEPRYIVVEKQCCGTCIHYRQHYILSEHGRPFPLWYGHCVAPRLKRREPDESCPYWAPAEGKRERQMAGVKEASS